jgi:rhamnose utilization protein RhaD (predicted bifunctional aldolase and dehydrogenase)
MNLPAGTGREIDDLLDVSARIGSRPLLVQAATGNTSIKLNGILWIKASGKWLAHARQEEILIPVSLSETRSSIEENANPAGQPVIAGGRALSVSVETPMHAVLPSKIVLHVHSVNTIAWAVRQDAPEELAARLDGIEWSWIPYSQSGLPLARAIEIAIAKAPQTVVLVLANHGLVICGEDCATAEALLEEVERRVEIMPRSTQEPSWSVLKRLADGEWWRVPQNPVIHSLGTDNVSRRIISGGVLYPCQAIFLTTAARTFPQSADVRILSAIEEPFAMIEGAGTLVRARPNPTELATLTGLAQVIQRIPETASVRYLRDYEVRDLLCADFYRYREMVENNGRGHGVSSIRAGNAETAFAAP